MGTARLVIRFTTEDVHRDFPAPGGCDVEFDATFDLGLIGVMDPIAERVLRRINCSVHAALFGEITIATVDTTGASTP